MAYPHQKDWLTAPDLAREAGVSENTARRWIKQHALGRKVGGRWRADPAVAAEFVALPLRGKTSAEMACAE